jgi:hypothetical protein
MTREVSEPNIAVWEYTLSDPKRKTHEQRKSLLCILQGQTIPYFSPRTSVTAKGLAVLGLWKIPSVVYIVNFNNTYQWTSTCMYSKITSGRNEIMDIKSKLSEGWGAMNDKYYISRLLISYGWQGLNVRTQMVTFISWLQFSASSCNYPSRVYHHYSLTT